MSFEFPFEYANIAGIGKLFYPIVRLEIKTVSGWQLFEFLVDTGADITTLPSELLPALGFNKSTLRMSYALGVGGFSVKSWEFLLQMKLGDTVFTARTSAVENKNDSMPLLLGRTDILDGKYSLTIDSKRKVTILTENK